MERRERDGEERGRAGAKRARARPVFTDKQEIIIVDFVKDHPELYAKEHVHYAEKGYKDALWEKIGKEIGRSGPDVHHWVLSQCTRYGKLTADMLKSKPGSSRELQGK